MVLSACGGGGSGEEPQPTEPPRITTQPKRVTVEAGQRATFSVVLQSERGVSYQWLRNGTAIAGATRADYSLEAASMADSFAVFSVVVSNAAGTLESDKVMLTVQALQNLARIAPATGALALLSKTQHFLSYARSGDLFLLNYSDLDGYRIERWNAAGAQVPLAGALKDLSGFTDWVHNTPVGLWKASVAVVEHADGHLYIAVGRLRNSGQINTEVGNGGQIFRIQPDGTVTLIYHSAAAGAARITPCKLVEGPGGLLYTVNLETMSLYSLSTSGVLSKVGSLTAQPVTNQVTTLAYWPSPSFGVTQSRRIFVSSLYGLNFQLDDGGALVPVDFGLERVSHLAVVGESVYALGNGTNGSSVVKHRAADGTITVFSGGARRPEDTSQMVGWLPIISGAFEGTRDGNIVVGVTTDEVNGLPLPYYVLIPPRG